MGVKAGPLNVGTMTSNGFDMCREEMLDILDKGWSCQEGGKGSWMQ